SRFDATDAYSRRAPAPTPDFRAGFKFGVPPAAQLEFFGDEAAAELFENAAAGLESVGGVRVEIDFAPFKETADLLYSGPWVAERLSAVQAFRDKHPGALWPTTEKIISGGANYDAVSTFRSFYRLEELRRVAEAEWAKMDVLLLPTSGTIYTHAQLAEEPVQYNTNLGYYTNFVNLLDLSGLAVPAGFRANGLPFGVTLLAPAFRDSALWVLGGRYHAALGGKLGGTDTPLAGLPAPTSTLTKTVQLAVVGAHLAGQPLNHQLTSRGATLVQTTRTATNYRLYALANTAPPKPGLVLDPTYTDGQGIEVEVWSLTEEAFGQFTAEVPAPLAIGTLVLADGSKVKGFVCEPAALTGATEITSHGGWRAYLASRR
ncbi:MAG: amidase family protein, partial [Verrucomicrobiota bacterium]